MELLQKFAAVEIQADCRITEMDKDYCVQHQKAYEAAISSFQELAFFWEDMNKAQQELLGDSKSPFFITIWFPMGDRLFRRSQSIVISKPCISTLL